jgi:hypothetical protein
MLEWLVDARDLPRLQIDIPDGVGTLVAPVEKPLYVRLKPQARQA